MHPYALRDDDVRVDVVARTLGIEPEASSRARFRGDVEGLRALAVGLVLLYHADRTLVPGGFIGVDVFFVISGFLITGLLLAEIQVTGTLSIIGFYVRRAKRLLPAVAVVLGSVAVLTVAFLPRLRWVDVGYDIVSGAGYVANWRFADRAVDYLAQDTAKSPVQHFWSLAVEEQFYLLWPLLLLAVVGAFRWLGRGRLPGSGALLACCAIVGVPSLAWSVHLTSEQPDRAYFVTTTRMWELAIGAGIAVLSAQLVRLPRMVAAMLAWAGLATVVASAFLLSAAQPFPGWIALAPTLGVAAVIAGGSSASDMGPGRLLGIPPLRAVGALSYSLYLWHWPLLVVAENRWGDLSRAGGLAVVLATVVPAYATYRWVENPIRRSTHLTVNRAAALQLGGFATLLTASAGLAVVLAAWPPPPPIERIVVSIAGDEDSQPQLGALVLSSDPREDQTGAPVDLVGSFVPSVLQAHDDVSPTYGRGCSVSEIESEAKVCDFGDLDSSFTVVLVGDSHAAQWVSPMIQIAVDRGWHLRVYTKSSCPLADVTVTRLGVPYDACTTWNHEVMTALTGAGRPDLVVAASVALYLDSSAGGPGDARAGFTNGLARTWAALGNDGVKVVAIVDTPRPGVDVPECVSINRSRLTACAVPRSEAVGTKAATQTDAASLVPGVSLIDLNDAICPTQVCAPVIGGVLVYRDDNHLTDTYARTLGPRLDAQLAAAVG